MICCIGSRISFGLRSPPWLHRMINGSGLSSTNFFKPLAIRSIVFGANGRTARMPYFSLISSDVSKIEGHGRLKSICVYVPTYGFNSPAFTSSLVCRSVCWLWSYNRLAVTGFDCAVLVGDQRSGMASLAFVAWKFWLSGETVRVFIVFLNGFIKTLHVFHCSL